MLAGVTVVDPATTWVDVGVRLGRDVVLHPGTQLHGAHGRRRRREVGPGHHARPTARSARARRSCAPTAARREIGPERVGRARSPTCGPARGSARAGKIGTFVEVKNAEIGAGSKVPHLTYVGDATIGEETNIGAASVFVNYDGVRKQRTVVGSHVRTGSDTMFIAPVHVGDGAYTGAGTVLRDDVPPGALAVSAGSQRIIEGWVEKNRPGTPAAEAAGRYRSGASSDAPDQTTAEEAPHDEFDVGHAEEEPHALLRPGPPGAGRAGGQAPRRHGHPAVGLLLRERRDLRPLRGVGTRLRRVRPAGALARRSTTRSWSS